MLSKDLRDTALWTLASFTVTLALFWNTSLNAGTDDAAKRVLPLMKVGHVEASLHIENARLDRVKSKLQLAPADVTCVTLTLTNNGPTLSTFPYKADLKLRGKADPLSRVPVQYTSIAVVNATVDLKPGETKVIPLTLKARLSAGTDGYIALTSGLDSLPSVVFVVAKQPVTASSTVAQHLPESSHNPL